VDGQRWFVGSAQVVAGRFQREQPHVCRHRGAERLVGDRAGTRERHADDRERGGARRARRRHLVQKPGRPVGDADAVAATEMPGEGADRRVAEQVQHADRHAEPADGADRPERVAAGVEEVVVDPDPVDAEHLGPAGGQFRLERGPGGDVGRGGGAGAFGRG
jgi:hypothetical protein